VLTAGHQSTQQAEARLVVRPTDIEFIDTGPGQIDFAIRITNAGPSRSHPTTVRIQAAVFGAFADWLPLARVRVPALDPGEAALLRTQANRATPEPLGPPDRLPPARLLTALGFHEQKPGKGVESTSVRPTLPPSPFDLLTGSSTYWAGNINVFVGKTSVERHMARALRIVPDRTNLAAFVVGAVGAGPDSYRFEVLGLGPAWDVRLMNPMQAVSMSRSLADGRPITPGDWISLPGASLLILVLRPPRKCRDADVAVHVTQQSTRKTAVVEFSFNPRAAGPGCYVVD
jgi:hypothetical protein